MPIGWCLILFVAAVLGSLVIFARVRPDVWWAEYFNTSFVPDIDLSEMSRRDLFRTSVTFLKLSVTSLLGLVFLKSVFSALDPSLSAFPVTNLIIFLVQTLAMVWTVGFLYTLVKGLLKGGEESACDPARRA